MSRFRHAAGLILAVAVFSVAASPGARAEKLIKPFLGTYVGSSISHVGEGLTKRDLKVVIKAIDNGFSLSWMTVWIRSSDKKKIRRSFTIRFQTTRRTKVFAAAMRTNMFGKRIPLDPMKGEPYFWASIVGKTLTVSGVHVTENGGYEVQVYKRTLTKDGMHVLFERLRDGKPLRSITGELKRAK